MRTVNFITEKTEELVPVYTFGSADPRRWIKKIVSFNPKGFWRKLRYKLRMFSYRGFLYKFSREYEDFSNWYKDATRQKEYKKKADTYEALKDGLPPLPPIVLPEQESYRNFSGSDLIPFLGNDLCSELSGISYDENIDMKLGVSGKMIFTFFDSDPRDTIECLKSNKPFDIVLYFRNEYQNAAVSVIKNVEISNWSYGFGLEDLVFEIEAKFSADKVIPFKNIPKLLRDKSLMDGMELTFQEIVNNEGYRNQFVDALKNLVEDKGGKSNGRGSKRSRSRRSISGRPNKK